MVLVKHFLAAAALLASAIADEPKTDAEAAEWFSQLETITIPDVAVLEERGKSPDDDDRRGRWPTPWMNDPYRGLSCPRGLDFNLPRRYSCNRNSCFKYVTIRRAA